MHLLMRREIPTLAVLLKRRKNIFTTAKCLCRRTVTKASTFLSVD